nr:MAG TPA: hypothetical protein [Caudoviricetes sp.]
MGEIVLLYNRINRRTNNIIYDNLWITRDSIIPYIRIKF